MSLELELVLKSVVGIHDADDLIGTGVLISISEKHAFILTCCHVVAGEKILKVQYRPKKRFLYETAIRVALSKKDDLALLRLDKTIAIPALAISAEEPEIYEKVWSVGHSAGYWGTVVEGLLTGMDGSNNDPDKIYQISGYVLPGGSGSALVDSEGELVGIVTSTMRSKEKDFNNIVFATPLPKIKEFLKLAMKNILK